MGEYQGGVRRPCNTELFFERDSGKLLAKGAHAEAAYNRYQMLASDESLPVCFLAFDGPCPYGYPVEDLLTSTALRIDFAKAHATLRAEHEEQSATDAAWRAGARKRKLARRAERRVG